MLAIHKKGEFSVSRSPSLPGPKASFLTVVGTLSRDALVS